MVSRKDVHILLFYSLTLFSERRREEKTLGLVMPGGGRKGWEERLLASLSREKERRREEKRRGDLSWPRHVLKRGIRRQGGSLGLVVTLRGEEEKKEKGGVLFSSL